MKIEFERNGKVIASGEGMAGIFAGLLADLEIMCPRSPNKVECEWECRVYRYVLEDPEIRGKQYFDARWTSGTASSSPERRTKRELVRFLGWDIP